MGFCLSFCLSGNTFFCPTIIPRKEGISMKPSSPHKPKLGFPTYAVLFSVGAIGYYSLEIAYRGYSHWSMAICGGLCVCLIFLANRKLSRLSLPVRALVGALIITAVEFVAGCILNLWLGWDIWNYSKLPLNLFGQITPVFSAVWFLLCLPVCFLCKLADDRLPRQKKAE